MNLRHDQTHQCGTSVRGAGSSCTRECLYQAGDLAEVRHGSEALHWRLGFFDIHRAVA